MLVSQSRVSYTPTSLLSQLLEKQRKLIAVNDRALRVWLRLQARNACPVFQGSALARVLSKEGCQASHATVEVVGVCLKKKKPEFNQALRFSVLAWIFPPGSPPASCFSQLDFFFYFAQMLACKHRQGKRRPMAVVFSFGEKLSLKPFPVHAQTALLPTPMAFGPLVGSWPEPF